MKERLKQIRVEAMLTQKDFAKKLDLTARSIINYEAGKREPSLELIARICALYTINKNWLLNNKGAMYSEKYICRSWQALLQQILNLTTHGYTNYDISRVPARKMARIHRIDDALKEKFKANLSKDQRYRRKKKGLANFIYLRWENLIVIMSTNGEFENIDISPLKKFDKSMLLKISDNLILNISEYNSKLTVYLSKETYKLIKTQILEFIEHNNKNAAIYTFNALNGIPAYKGVIKQKRQMYREILKARKKSNIDFKNDLLKIRTFRKIYNVY